MGFDLLLHSRGHHDDTDDGDQQEIERVHDPGPRRLLDLGATVTATGAGRPAAAAGHLYAQDMTRVGYKYAHFVDGTAGCLMTAQKQK